MSMSPLLRQCLIGCVITLGIAAVIAALWLRTSQAERSLAARLPADAVLFYAELSDTDHSSFLQTIAAVAPRLALPTIPPHASAIAAVQGSDGNNGWFIRTTDQFGINHIVGSDPSLATIIDAPRPVLEDNPSFHILRMESDVSWAYLAFPKLSSDGSTLHPFLSLDAPLAIRRSASGIVLRQRIEAPTNMARWSGAPMALPPNLSQTILLPSWNDLRALSPRLSPETRDVAEALTRTFFSTFTGERRTSMDAAILLHKPSILLFGRDGSGHTVFSLEGYGRSAAETDSLLRSMHEHVAASHGMARVKTVSAEGYSFQTISRDTQGNTSEQTDNHWTILTTRTDDGMLVSARNDTHFVITTTPDALLLHATDSHFAPETSSLTWIDGLSTRIGPLWPTLQPRNTTLRFELIGGPGFVEWSLEPILAL